MSTKSLFEWKPEYCIGVERVDAQHRQLFALVNELHQAMLTGQAKDDLHRLFERLITYTLSHFSDEENAMKRASYPGVQQHLQEHAELVKRVNELRQRMQYGHLVVTLETMTFLKHWLKDHILGTDMQFGNWSRKQQPAVLAGARR